MSTETASYSGLVPSSPKDLGFSDRFSHWRPGQVKAVEDGARSGKRFVVQKLGVGFGKSLTAMVQGVLSGVRVMYVTATIGLQTALLDAFEVKPGLVEIMGQNNYTCDGLLGKKCDEGKVSKCSYAGSTLCAYDCAKQRANDANFVTTNYTCWITSNKYGKGFGYFDMVILDEAHNAEAALTAAMQIQLSDREVCDLLGFDWPDLRSRLGEGSMAAWKAWARRAGAKASVELEERKQKILMESKPPDTLVREYRLFNDIYNKLADIANARPEDWVADTYQRGYQFDPVDASKYAERLLYAKATRVLLMSGTIRPKSTVMLGIPDSELEFFEYQHGEVDLGRSPIYYIPTAKIDRNSTAYQYDAWVARNDEIFESRAEWRGIIHTGNYKLRDYLLEHSEYSSKMMSNYTMNGDLTADIIKQFKATKPPIALVTPSVTTGYDFSGPEARWQVIAKIPFPNSQSRIEEERQRRDPARPFHQTMQLLGQIWGRPLRSPEDWAETIIIDDNIKWLLQWYGELADPWFIAHYRKVSELPKPLWEKRGGS